MAFDFISTNLACFVQNMVDWVFGIILCIVQNTGGLPLGFEGPLMHILAGMCDKSALSKLHKSVERGTLEQRIPLYHRLCAKCGWISSFLGLIFRSRHDRPRLEYAVRIDGMLPRLWLESAYDELYEPWSSADATALSPPKLPDCRRQDFQ